MDPLNTEIRYETAATLAHEPSELGLATSGTVTIYTPEGTEHVASQAIGLEAADTTLTAAADVGSQALTVDDVTGFLAGRSYLLENASAQTEYVRVSAINTSGKILSLARPLAFAYLTGDALVGRALGVSLSALETTPLDEGYEARWEYAIDGTTYYATSLFDVVRYPWPDIVLQTW